MAAHAFDTDATADAIAHAAEAYRRLHTFSFGTTSADRDRLVILDELAAALNLRDDVVFENDDEGEDA